MTRRARSDKKPPRRGGEGYSSDIPYLCDFKPPLAPAWLDHVALVRGIEPPARNNGFAWCDLGCGQGVTAAVLAATHPRGVLHGIDAMPVWLALPCGTALEVDRELIRRLRDGAEIDHRSFPGWRDFLAAHGLGTAQ